MIKGIEFTKSMICDKDVAVQVAEYCNIHHITKDKIIDIKYTKANNGTCCASAMLIYEEFDGEKMRDVKDIWREFGDVPMNPETECIEEAWRGFPAGTHREEIWHWFEETFHVRIYDLMYSR